jgi:hypothetical protein
LDEPEYNSAVVDSGTANDFVDFGGKFLAAIHVGIFDL